MYIISDIGERLISDIFFAGNYEEFIIINSFILLFQFRTFIIIMLDYAL